MKYCSTNNNSEILDDVTKVHGQRDVVSVMKRKQKSLFAESDTWDVDWSKAKLRGHIQLQQRHQLVTTKLTEHTYPSLYSCYVIVFIKKQHECRVLITNITISMKICAVLKKNKQRSKELFCATVVNFCVLPWLWCAPGRELNLIRGLRRVVGNKGRIRTKVIK